MMELKRCQRDSLAALRSFLEHARAGGPANAFQQVTSAPDIAPRLAGFDRRYAPLEALPNAPYVCLRLPTGGGKTILAAHSIGVARDAWIEKDYPLVLWLVPSNIIRTQTAEALKNTRHPYRHAIDEAFGGRVRVFDIADFEAITPHDMRDNCCIVVATIQTLRVQNTEGRRVYAHNENMEPHFAGVAQNAEVLERRDGGIKFSFANVLHLHRPLMIVDEAHNALTGLTREMQARVNPCAILEFSATPRATNNVLYRVTAQELKDEQLIKLPIILGEHDSWQNAVNGAVATRASLAQIAERESEYLRPIILFQGQPRDEEVTVEVLKKHLMEAEQIPEERIAIATGDQRELDGIDLLDKSTKIECVITVQALKEGWDCPFAYVFCSVARIRSATDVEQLLGRVLRMPYARKRQAPELNRAYAHLSEDSFGEAAKGLVDKLIDMGFEADEAKDAVQQTSFDPELFSARERRRPVFRHTVQVSGDAAAALVQQAQKVGVPVRESEGGVEIASEHRIGAALEAALLEVLPEPERPGFAEAVRQFRIDTHDLLTPAELGKPFIVPALMAEVQGELVFAATDRFMEDHDWSIRQYPAIFGEAEFAIRETARSFEIDVEGERLTYQFAREDEQLALDIDVAGWTPTNLVLWLDRHLRQPDILQSQLVGWLSECVHHLVEVRKIPTASLMRCKFILARKLRDRIAAARQSEQDKAYQQALFAPASRVAVSYECGFEFRDGMYADQRKHHSGRFRFRNHFLGPDNVPAFSGTEEGEEFECAQVLDGMPEVEFWIRNVARHPSSMKLPTATDFFYPDFVAKLKDGRLFVVEYKGWRDMRAPDTLEKNAVGALWERAMGGKGVFATVTKEWQGRSVRDQLLAALS